MPGRKQEADMTAIREEGQSTDRRQGDRRKRQVPIDFPDRRKGDRRSGEDRRAHPRD